MAELFNITHDAGNLNEYDVTVVDGGDLSAGAPGLAGTAAKMEVLIDDANAIYGRKDFNKVVTFRCRFYVDPNSLSFDDADSHVIHNIYQGGGAFFALVLVYLRYHIATGYSLGFGGNQDGGGVAFWDTGNITDDPHYIEYLMIRADTDISVDGSYQWWIDGVNQGGSGAAVDNFNLFDDQNWRAKLGAVSAIDVNTDGTYYLDELKANDDGGEIGPVAPPVGGHMTLWGRYWGP